MIPDVGAVARGVIARYPAAAMYMGNATGNRKYDI